MTDVNRQTETKSRTLILLHSVPCPVVVCDEVRVGRCVYIGVYACLWSISIHVSLLLLLLLHSLLCLSLRPPRVHSQVG